MHVMVTRNSWTTGMTSFDGRTCVGVIVGGGDVGGGDVGGGAVGGGITTGATGGATACVTGTGPVVGGVVGNGAGRTVVGTVGRTTRFASARFAVVEDVGAAAFDSGSSEHATDAHITSAATAITRNPCIARESYLLLAELSVRRVQTRTGKPAAPSACLASLGVCSVK